MAIWAAVLRSARFPSETAATTSSLATNPALSAHRQDGAAGLTESLHQAGGDVLTDDDVIAESVDTWLVTQDLQGTPQGRSITIRPGLLYELELELGHWLLPEAQGRGYATEASAAARDFAFSVLGAESLASHIDPQSDPTKRSAQRLWADFERTIELEPMDVLQETYSEAFRSLPGFQQTHHVCAEDRHP